MARSIEFGAIFDCDGTLIDSMTVWRGLEANLGRRAGVALTPEQSAALGPMTIPEVAIFFHEQCGLADSAEAVKAMIDDYMMDFYCHQAKPRPGAVAFVQGLAERGVHQSVASTTPTPLLEAAMTAIGIADALDCILSVDDVGASKRHPRIFDRAREIMGTPLQATWGFEDSLYAVETLKRAGYATCGVYDCDISGTFEELERACDYVIKDFTALTPAAFIELASSRL